MTSNAPVAIIAGAGAAGSAIARALASAGIIVEVVDSRLESAERALAPILAQGQTGTAHAVDLLEVAGVEALLDDITDRHGRLDIVIHVVGGWKGSKAFSLASLTNWDELNPPIVGTLATLTSVCAAPVKASDIGRVVMVSSTAARQKASAGNVAYVAAKAAAEAWMSGVADEFDGSQAAAVTFAVRALLNDNMIESDPQKSWPGYTHVELLAAQILLVVTEPTQNGAYIDLTLAEYLAT